MYNPKYKPNKKNGGQTPAVNDKRAMYVPIGCGNCIECRKQKARGWQLRLLEDIKANTNGKFITLTLSNENYTKLYTEIKNNTKQWTVVKLLSLSQIKRQLKPSCTKYKYYKFVKHIQQKCFATGYDLDNEIITLATRRFLERWRKEYKKSLRHWLVTELGHNGTENIHLHGIIWPTEQTQFEQLVNIWNYGYVWPRTKTKAFYTNYVNAQTVNYIIKYVTKIDEQHKYYKSRILTSPGIGSNYTANEYSGNWHKTKYKGAETIDTYRTETGHKITMPTYWRNKIYTEEQREQLWMQKLDKEVRYVLGQEIDISNNFNEYLGALETARALNNQLGYGNDTIDWSRKEYENIIREIKQHTRLKKQ